MSKLEAKLPIQMMRVQQDCTVCGTDGRIEVDVSSLDAEGVELVATLVGCLVCKTGLCRED